ncbi:MAG: hypothetical protein ACJAT0_001285 [Nonlabens sp.]|jgi:hypothetical protein|uniref:EpsG family protein n=1 Tax=Nonlabens sp. TaxID=1888209 RepID=UPI0039E2BD28
MEKKNTLIKLAIFFINPLFGFIISLKRIGADSSFLIFFLFSIAFGISFTVPDNRSGDYTGDGVAYRLKFERIAVYDTDKFNLIFTDYTEFDDGDKDIYATIVAFVVSRFTNNYHWLFGFYAAVFSFFMLKSLRFLTREENYRNDLYGFFLATIFIMSNPIFNINGARFWTAAWIGVYCIFQIFQNNNKKYLLLACLTPLVHVSFFAYLLILIIALLTKRWNKFWVVLFIASFLISEIAFFFLESLETYLPEFISRIVRLYTDPEIMATKEQSRVWFAFIFTWPPRIIVNLIILFFIKKKLLIQQNDKAFNLYLFLMVWMSFVNFTMLIPSLGSRFFQLSLPLIALIWLTVFDNKKYFNWIVAAIICFSPSYAYFLNLIFEVTEIEFYVTNPIYLVYNYLYL